MSFAFYIYTTIIMGVALVTSAVALVVWLMTRRRDSLVAAAGFLLYMLDMSVIFFDEYNRLKYDSTVAFTEHAAPFAALRARYCHLCLRGTVDVCALAQKADVANARIRYRAVFNLAIGAGAPQRRCRRSAAVSLLAYARPGQCRMPRLCRLALSAQSHAC